MSLRRPIVLLRACGIHRTLLTIKYGRSYSCRTESPKLPQWSWLLQTRKFRRFGFSLCCGWRIHATTEASEEVNRKYRPKNTMVQLSTPKPTLSAILHSVTDGRTDRRTDKWQSPIADHTVQQYINKWWYCIIVHTRYNGHHKAAEEEGDQGIIGK